MKKLQTLLSKLPFTKKKRSDGRVLDTYKKNYTWQYIDSACEEIADKCKQADIKHIIGISRGGLIPAVLLSKYLNVREVISVGVRSYNDGEDYATREHTPKVYQDIVYSSPQLWRGEPVLLVDDISDEGNTFKYLTDTLRNHATLNLYTASLFIKSKTKFKPDVYYSSLPNNEWVIFPWEK